MGKLYHVYIDGFCLHVTESKPQARAFLDMMGEEGYRGEIFEVNNYQTDKDKDQPKEE